MGLFGSEKFPHYGNEDASVPRGAVQHFQPRESGSSGERYKFVKLWIDHQRTARATSSVRAEISILESSPQLADSLASRCGLAAADVLGDVEVKEFVEATRDGPGSDGNFLAGDFTDSDQIAIRGRDEYFVRSGEVFLL